MKISHVPGYKELFPDGSETYEELVDCIPSEMVIRICSALNNELNGVGGMAGNQLSILQGFAQTFSAKERKVINEGLQAFHEKAGKDTPIILFATRYLLTMVLKELNHFRTDVPASDGRPMEFALLKAYFLVVDEVAQTDHNGIDFKALVSGQRENLLKIIYCILPVIQSLFLLILALNR